MAAAAKDDPTPMIELVHFTKRYGKLLAVDDLNLRIGPGELFGFIGPNGAGKSTTIRFLATLLRATSGDGLVAGHSVTREPLAVRRSIGYMPDTFGLYDGMRVWDFLEFFAVACRVSRDRRKRVIDDVIGRLDLGGKRKALVTSLSRGMKQRLCLAKTLLHDPPVLILDEPASGLDPKARIEIKTLLHELAAAGKTILISSHVLGELADTCTSVGIVDRGKLVMHGPIGEVQRRIGQNRTVRIKFLERGRFGIGRDPRPERRSRRAGRGELRDRGTLRRRSGRGQPAPAARGLREPHLVLRREGADAGGRLPQRHARKPVGYALA